METELTFKIVGNYSIEQADPEDFCRICGEPIMGTILVKDGTEYICAECLFDIYCTSEKF